MERKVIDFHTHAFPDKIAGKTIEMLSQRAGIPAHSDGTAEGLRTALIKAGISLGVVLPVVTRAEQFDSVTRFAVQINEEGNRLLSFGGIHPDAPEYRKELKRLAALGFRGIKIHPDYQGVYFDDIRYMRIVEYASELGFIVLTHAGIDIGIPEPVRCTPERVRRVLREVKPEKLVLAHCGGWGRWNEVIDKLAGEAVYMDTAYSMGHISEEMFERLCRSHGLEKMLFATDCPWGSPEKDLETFLGMRFTQEEQELVLHRNAERLLGLII